jgi:NADH:ubiquinone reductase (H+-translocating)
MRKHVVIVGGGFGGLAAAKALRGADVRVTLVDRRNHHLFQPLLYQVATAGLAPADIAEPLRSLLRRQENCVVRLAAVESIDVAGRTLALTPVPDPDQVVSTLQPTETLAWDRLILAAGASHAYFGRDEWERFAPGLKTIGDALEIRRRVLTAFERAEWTEDPAERAACMTFLVIGGGPTGVELAGALAEVAFKTMRHDFRRIDTRASKVILLEGGGEILSTYSPSLQQKATRALEKMGVEVRVGARVTNIDDKGVDLQSGERIQAETVLWAAGVAGAPVARSLGVPLDRAGRVTVLPDLSVEGLPDVFVVGDLAIFAGPDGRPLPGVAPVAMGQGARAGENVRADVEGRPRRPFAYFDKGNMATIGRSRAVLQRNSIQIYGMLAWLAWVFIHLMFLVTFRSRIVVFVKWAWAYISQERANRLIWQGEVRRIGERRA